MLVLLPALNAVELFDIFGFVLGDSNAVPMIPLLAVVTTSEIRLVILRILDLLGSVTHIMNLLTSVLLQMQ